MQCMMKEICAQCLQPHRDPATGEETNVFSCFNQDQRLDLVDFQALGQRLGQNRVQERLTSLWIESCLKVLKAARDRNWSARRCEPMRVPELVDQETR
jgi:hypothetical protein